MVRIGRIFINLKLGLYSKIVQYLNMNITVKLVYKGNCFKFAPHTNTISLIQQEMNKRFHQKLPTLQYYYQGELVLNLQPFLEKIAKEGKNSLKLEAKAVSQQQQNKSFISEQSFIKQIQQEKPCELKENTITIQEKAQTIKKGDSAAKCLKKLMPRQFYICYKCNGEGMYKQNELFKLCQVCEGKGQFNHQHIYIQHLSKLFQKHVGSLSEKQQEKQSEKLQQNQMLNVQKQVIKCEMSELKFRQINKSFYLSIQDKTKIEKMQIGKQFSYSFQIENTGIQFPSGLYLVDCDTKESRLVKSLQKGETMTIEVGPFTCQDESLLVKVYYLCYRVQNSWMRIGYRFGLRVRGVKKVEIKCLQQVMSQSVMSRMCDLKSISNSEKSEAYLVVKLKGMGIDVQKIQMQDQLLIEIIKSIQ